MKCIFTVDGINYLSPTKREARKFMRYWNKQALTFQYPRPFKTNWRFKHIEKAPSYGQLQRVNFDKVGF